jgi:tetratricopeptide (TPR) repeat protein
MLNARLKKTIMNKHITISLSLAALLLFTGCRKFLKEASQDELTPTTTTSINELLAKEGYPYVATAASASDGYSLCNYLNLMDDDMHLQNIPSSATLTSYVKPFYKWSDNVYEEAAPGAANGAKDPYQSLYNRIRGCNVVMDMLPEVSGPEADKEQIRGEALALRAYYYLMLVNLYSWPYNDSVHDKNTSLGVPIISKGNISDVAVARSTVKQVYDLITADIENAVLLLKKKKSISTVFRINYRTAWLLASRIYLYMEQWNKAIEYTNKLIGEYPLLADLNARALPVAQGGTGTKNASFLEPSNVEILFMCSGLRSGDLELINTGTSLSCIASTDLTSQFEANDMRFGVYNSTNPPPNFFLTLQNGYYTNSKVYYSNGQSSRSFRMAEAYVNRAESYIRTAIQNGDASLLQKALDDLNALRIKRFKSGASNAIVSLASLNNDPQQVLRFCLTERRREFSFEEMRWFDLRRYGMPSIVHTFNPNEPYVINTALPVETYTLPEGSERYVMKIPQIAFDANPALIQNP